MVKEEAARKFKEEWDKKYTQVYLEQEIYPNKEIPRAFLIVTRGELKRLNSNTTKRIRLYNKKKPKNWATYEYLGV